MKFVVETDRLILREHTEEDAEQAYLLNLDPEVIKYTGDVSFNSIAEAKHFLKNYEHYKTYGFGRWAVINKDCQEYLGWCGLKYSPDLNEYDIGFRFFKKYWNKGYATEAAKVCLELGFTQFGIQVIVGRAMHENRASIKVLKKIGLSFVEERTCGDQAGVLYKIERSKATNDTND